MLFDYRAERTWSAVKLNTTMTRGRSAEGPTPSSWIGPIWARVCAMPTRLPSIWRLAGGSLGNIFDSKIEFSSLFDGILLKYDLASEKVGDFYAHGGVFFSERKRSQYAYVGEFGMMRIAKNEFLHEIFHHRLGYQRRTHAGQPFARPLKIILSLSFPSSFLDIDGRR